VKRELEESASERGGGRVRTLIYDFETEEERLAWEERRRKSWETRLAREIEIKIRLLREKIGLTAPQEGRLREILEREYQERLRLVDLLNAKQISRTTFDQGVRENTQQGRAELRELLTPRQLEVYEQLNPREQVLRDEVK
jgi:hypothetical protein